MATSSDSPATLNELLLNAVDRHRKPDAFLSKSQGRYQPVSSEEALLQAAALARGLEKLGIARGDRLAILSDNRLEWALTDYAVLGLGAVGVPIYPTLLEDDLEYILRDSGAKGIVLSSADQLRKIRNIRNELPDLRFVLAMDPLGPEADVENWWDVVRREREPDPVHAFRERAGRAQAAEIATILYTSGTTGNPKGVVLTHSNIVSNIQAAVDLFPMGTHDVGLSFLPLSHIFERMLDYAYVRKGVSLAYAESFDALPQNLLEVRPTVMAVVPRVLERVHEKVEEMVHKGPPLKQKIFRWALRVGEAAVPYRLEALKMPLGLGLRRALADRLVFSKIRERLGGQVTVIFSGSAPLAADVARFFWAVGLNVYEGYGLTETSPVITVNYPGKTRLGTVGPVIPGVEVRLGSDYSNDDDRVGREILVRGPNVSPGYYHLEDENRESFTDGWFNTGDLGAFDADGYLVITGRKKYLFKTSGGKYVPPEKLENLFQAQPYVAQALVIGDRRKFVSALIVPNFALLEAYAHGHGISFSSRADLAAHPEIRSFMEHQVETLMAHLPPHERVRQIALLTHEFTIASGELSPTQKIRRRVVEERYRDTIEEIYQRHAPQPHGA
ncbi:MAG TPA: long-chain fatty acid--CoA ligase [Terriglobia bacterium]|nr:long-chain fatty acid--CoA ligase [Terriglobia bacterium]